MVYADEARKVLLKYVANNTEVESEPAKISKVMEDFMKRQISIGEELYHIEEKDGKLYCPNIIHDFEALELIQAVKFNKTKGTVSITYSGHSLSGKIVVPQTLEKLAIRENQQ